MKLRAPPGAAMVVWVLAIVNLYYFRVADPDLWVHLRCGTDILQSGQIKQVDIYSFTAAGLPLLSHEWLSQTLFAWLFRFGGPVALIGLKMAVGIAFLLFFWRLLRLHCEEWQILLPLFLIGAHAVGRYLLFRPQMFTFLFLTITLYILEIHRRRATQAVWILPGLIWIWANLHAGFTVGLALIGYYGVMMAWTNRNAAKQLGWVLLISTLATLVNPHEFLLWKCIAQTTFDPLGHRYVQEWQPVWRSTGSWNSLLFFGLAATAIVTTACCRKRNWGDTLLLLIFLLLGASATRHLPLFAIVALPIIGKSLASLPENRQRNLLLAVIAGIVFLPVVITSRCVLEDWRPRVRILDDHYRGFPYQAVEFLKRQPVSGNAWNELAWGGYMIWSLQPQWKVSLDGRNLNLYPSTVMRDHFELFASEKPDLTVLDRYPIDLCIFAKERKLTDAMTASGHWELIYRDEKAVIFRSRTSALTNLIPQTAMTLHSPPTEFFLER